MLDLFNDSLAICDLASSRFNQLSQGLIMPSFVSVAYTVVNYSDGVPMPCSVHCRCKHTDIGKSTTDVEFSDEFGSQRLDKTPVFECGIIRLLEDQVLICVYLMEDRVLEIRPH